MTAIRPQGTAKHDLEQHNEERIAVFPKMPIGVCHASPCSFAIPGEPVIKRVKLFATKQSERNNHILKPNNKPNDKSNHRIEAPFNKSKPTRAPNIGTDAENQGD